MLKVNRGHVTGSIEDFAAAFRARRAELSENEREGWEALLADGEPLHLLLRPADLTFVEEFD